jgi:hypothetical protein
MLGEFIPFGLETGDKHASSIYHKGLWLSLNRLFLSVTVGNCLEGEQAMRGSSYI